MPRTSFCEVLFMLWQAGSLLNSSKLCTAKVNCRGITEVITARKDRIDEPQEATCCTEQAEEASPAKAARTAEPPTDTGKAFAQADRTPG